MSDVTEYQYRTIDQLVRIASAFERIAAAQERRNLLLIDSNENQQEALIIARGQAEDYKTASQSIPELIALKGIMEQGMPLLIDIQAKLDAFAGEGTKEQL